MAADRTLAEDDHAAREDVRAFHGDCDRHELVGAAEIIVRAQANAFAAVDIHGIVDDCAHALRHVIFHDGRGHRWFLAQIDRAGSHHPRRIHHVGVATDARQGFLHTLEFSDRRGELLAYAGVRAGRPGAEFGGGDGLCR